MKDQILYFDTDRKSNKVALAGAGAAGAVTLAVVSVQPSQAAGDGVSEVTTMVSSLGGLATAALAVAVVPIGVYFAIRIVKRVMNA
jgi:hypothetical protein